MRMIKRIEALAKRLTQWLINKRKAARVTAVKEIRATDPELWSRLTDEEIELWIYGGIL